MLTEKTYPIQDASQHQEDERQREDNVDKINALIHEDY